MKLHLMASYLLLIFFSACGGPKTIHGKLAYGIINSYSRQMEKTKGFQTMGTGGSMLGDVKVLSMTYVSREQVDLSTARILFVETAQGLLNKVNRDEKIRPYLHDYPFTENNLDMAIMFYDKNFKYYEKEYIALAVMIKDKVCYAIFDPETDQLKEFYEEPYEEALRIVQEECSFPN